ncbi:MAG TPA: hypothetical protein VJ203_08855 [Bacteroidales bacterium]|nr:hypothetical protein [Bacteroidales bacterium]
MPKKVLVVYYTQTGQLREIVSSITAPLATEDDITLVFEELKPKPGFPFPWPADQFFQAMPESVKGIPCELETLSVSGEENFDLIIVAWQPWFLSPSIPIHAFFQLEAAKKMLPGKPVITLIGSRNMWVMAQEQIKKYINGANGRLVGNIVLYDKNPNLLSVVSIIRWLIQGKKDRYMGIIPAAGVSDEDILSSSRFGHLIVDAMKTGNYDSLQRDLVNKGAVNVLPGILMIEKRGIILFRLWANFILKKGSYGDKARQRRVRLFKYYLLAVLYLVSPFASILFFLIKPFRGKAIKKQISLYQST